MAAGGCRQPEPAPPPLTPVRVQAVEPAPGGNTLRYSATIQPLAQINLAFKVGGYVASIRQVPGVGGAPRPVQEGDRVAKGTALAVLQQADYQTQVNNARAQLASANAVLDKAQRDFARAKSLYDDQSLTRSDYDAAKTSLDTAQANTDLARQSLAAAEIPLADTSLRTPIDAIIVSRKIELGTFAQPGAVGFVVASIGAVKAVFSVPDTVVGRLKLGTALPVVFESGVADPERRGPITAISPSADPQSRVFQVEVTLPNPRGDLRLGTTGTVTLPGEGPAAAQPVVPLSAVVRAAPGSTAYAVFVIEDQGGKTLARRRQVALGDVLGNRIVVRDGLRDGERVIVSGATLAVDGQPVRIVP